MGTEREKAGGHMKKLKKLFSSLGQLLRESRGLDKKTPSWFVIILLIASVFLALLPEWFHGFREDRSNKKLIQADFEKWPVVTEYGPEADVPASVLLSFTNQRVQLHGREQEKEQLMDFFLQKTKAPSIWAIIDRSESENSKLAFECINAFTQSYAQWKKIWWQADNGLSEEWTKADYPYDLILVVPDTGSQVQELRPLLTQLTAERKNKLRIVLLERDNISENGQPSWLKTLLGTDSDFTQKPHFQNYFYRLSSGVFTSDSFLALSPLSEDSQRQILRDFLGSIEEVRENRLLEQAEELADGQESITPLHLLMAASVGEDFKGKDREELFRTLLDKEEKRWQKLCGEGEPLIRKLLLFATLTGHWDMDSQVPALLLTEEERKSAKRFFREHPHRETLFGELGGSNEQHDLSGLMPDLLGEYFALKELSFLSTKERKALSGELWQGKETHKGYYDFLYRAISDYPQHGVIKEALEPLPDDEDKAGLLNHYGKRLDDLGAYREAVELHKNALEIRLRVLGEAHPDTAMSYNNLGNAYAGLGQYHKAMKLHKKALEIRLRVLGEDHPATADTYNNMGVEYGDLGEYEKAIEQLENALEIYLRVLGEDHPYTAISYNNLGNAYYGLEEYEKAVELHKKAFPIFHRNLGINHPYTRTCFDNIFRCAEAMGDNETAERYEYFAEHGCFPEDAP